MTTEPPKPPPALLAQMDQLYASCSDMLDNYISGFELDLNRHAVKHGSMSQTEQHYHLTKILASQVPPNMLAGIAAAAVVRGIARKVKGGG